MGRDSTGAWTVSEAKRIELSFLLKNGYLKKQTITSGTLSWNWNGEASGSISIRVDTIASNPFMELTYVMTDKHTQEKRDYSYKVFFKSQKSNLGVGNRWYFICPVSEKSCSVLYMAYNSTYFKCRDAYNNRIYYDGQIESKGVRNYKLFYYERKIEELCMKKEKSHYRGKPTKLMQRIELIELKSAYNYDIFKVNNNYY